MKKQTTYFTSSLVLLLLVLSCVTFSCKSTTQATTSTMKEASLPTTFILVRHAEKAKDGSKNPNLTKIGQERAERLKTMLQAVGVTAIYSTNYNRTRQTVEPLAKLLNLNIQAYEAHDKTILDQLKTAQAGGVVLMAGHSNTVPAMVNHLLGSDTYADLDESDYDNLFMVTCGERQVAKVLQLKF